jgi:beta-lactamase regulating signal transducer with metallopeptidase domain
MSITASYVAVGVILVRIFLRKAPKIFSYVLWAAVFFRLVCPLSFTSAYSFLGLLNIDSQKNVDVLEYVSNDIGLMQTPTVQSRIGSLDSAVNSSLHQAVPFASVNPMQIWMDVLCFIWIVGIVVMLSYGVISYIKVKRRILTATLVKGNVYESDQIGTAFICGFFNPKIYVPVGVSEDNLFYILEHERTHIRRKDYIIKLFAFFALVLHWFNPLMWLSFALMSRDMEMSCDESVLQKSHDVKKGYSSSLLALFVKENGLFAVNPLAFGGSHVKARIKNILSYKKPKFYIIIAAILILIIAGFGLLSNPQEPVNEERTDLSIEEYADQYIEETIAAYNTDDYYFKIVEKKIIKLEKIAYIEGLLPEDTLEIWSLEYRLRPEDMSKIILAGGMNEEDGWITEDSSMGKPMLVFAHEGSAPQFLGVIWSGEANLATPAGQETALRVFLETKDMLPQETYSGNHIVVKFPLSTGETCQLLLSQPIIQGDHGIWCIERWMDGNGTVYHETPKTDIRSLEYFQELQNEVDQGHKPGLIDPLQVAIEWINNDLGQNVSLNELEPKYSATVDDFLVTPESRFIGFISDFETEKSPRPYFHLDQIEWLTSADTERLKELNINPDNVMPGGFYIYNPDNYPTHHQVTENTTYNIIELGEEVTLKSVSMEDFVEHLEHFADFTPPFWITTKDGYVQDITEQYVP